MTEAQLVACMPRVRHVAIWTAALMEAMSRYDIATQARTAAFLAQVAHESDDCRRLVEHLHYSAARLRAVWPRRFSMDLAREYAAQPERIANYVYAHRLGNGPVASGDGWRFRGRGLIQITGRANYRASGVALGLDLEAHPESLTEPLIAALSAAQFWSSRGCNELADHREGDDDAEDFEHISVVINGGRTGLPDRLVRWQRAKAALAA